MTGQTAKTKKIFDGRYEILSIVGRGARSVVYHARHVGTPATEVALKVLIDQKGKNPSAERLRREALAMVSCRHRYIARLDDFHSVGSLCYLSMEYAPESDLRNFAKKNGGKIEVVQAERFLKQSAEGIAFVHRAGIIHRDIKPENILVMNDKEVRITDFGVALLPGEECSIADLQSGVGTMNYMAPEILEGRPADQRSDLYALGVVFYELISGKNPFAGAPLAKQIDIRKSESFPNLTQLDPTIPQYLSDLILQCMRHDPDKRFSSGDDLLASLLNKKSDNFSQEQKAQRQKPARPKTNNLHKRPRKIQANKARNQDNEDIFEEFDRLVAEEATAEKPTSGDAGSTLPNDVTAAAAQAAIQNDIFSDNPANEEEGLFAESETEAAEQELVSENPSQVSSLAEQISAKPNEEDSDFDHFEEEVPNKNNRAKSFDSSKQGQHKYRGFIIVASLLFFALSLPSIRHSLSGAVHSLAFWKQSTLELPIYEANELSFPAIPKGVFSGSLEGALPGKTTPLTIISFGETGKIAVLLGIEGWTPVVIDQQDITKSGSKNPKTLRVASNGIILEMNGEVKNGIITGYFSNLINGAQGQWNVEPAV